MKNVIALLRRYLDRLLRSRFVGNVTLMASGTVGAQAITMAFAPLITRLYGPEAFGLLGTFTVMVGVVIPLAALAYPIAIVLPKEDRDALGLARLSVLLSLVVALFAAIMLWIGGGWLITALNIELIADFLLFIPLTILLVAWMQIARQWLIRKSKYNVISGAAIANSLILNSAKAGIGWFHPGAAALILLTMMGYAVHASFLFIGARRVYKPSFDVSTKQPAKSLLEIAQCHRDFPLFRAPQNFINAASQSLPVLMLAGFFGPAAAGFYTLGSMVMGLPSSLVGKAVNDVFYPRINEATHNGEDIVRYIGLVTGVLFAVGIVPFGLVVVFGPWLFSLVFGAEWEMAGEYARWLALFFLFNFINKPSVAAVPVLRIQRGLLVYEFLSTGGKASGLLVGFYWFSSDLWAVALFSIIGMIAYSIMMFWIFLHALRWGADAKTSR